MMSCLLVACTMGSFLMSTSAKSLRNGVVSLLKHCGYCIHFSTRTNLTTIGPLHIHKVPDQDRKLQFGLEPIETLNCHIQLLNGQFEDGSEEEIYACTLSSSETDIGGFMYSVDFSEDFINDNKDCIKKGACYVDIPGAQVIDEEGVTPTIAFPAGAELSVIDKSESVDSPTERRQLALTGSNEVLIVRVTSRQAACRPSTGALAASILGIDRSSYSVTTSMKMQYERCSQGQFSVEAITGNRVVNGVVDVYMDRNTNGVNIFDLTNAMFSAASSAVGNSLNARPKHIMYIVPKGTTFNGSSGWVAFAHVSGYNGWYNDEWGMSLSATMHEVGHNLGT